MINTNLKILIVDDAAAMRVSMLNMLKELGFTRFSESSGGNPALALLKSGERFDVIFSDHQMPDGTGQEFLQQLRGLQDCEKTTFFFVSSETDEAMIQQGIARGANGNITKPVSLEQLRLVLSDLKIKE
jgi:CheY-like chemotaxis protein